MRLLKQHETVSLIVLLSALIVTAARAVDQVTIRISPDTQAIPEMGVPFLHEKIAEHHL
jgi:hypothetical protein